jgi:uncharacterized membrane protein YhfC
MKTPAPGAPPYTLVIIIAILSAALLIGLILWLRPAYDPLLVVTAVGGFATTMGQLVTNFLKTQETHDAVDGITHDWQAVQSELSRAQGMAQGIADEQARVLPVVAKKEKTD